jgi:hypothetical protein
MFQRESLLGLEFLKRLLLKNHASFESLQIGRLGRELPRLPQPQRELSKFGTTNTNRSDQCEHTVNLFKLSDRVLR